MKSYSSIEELLADDISLVVVNTPIDTHYQYAKQALEAGKHVLVEKAFTTTVAEAEELHRIAQANGLTLTVYQNRRWDSDFKTVQSVIEKGLLGDVVEAEIRFDRYKPTLNTNAWKEEPTPGAGILKDLGPHVIDQALCLFGMPEAVFADIRVVIPETRIDDQFDILLYYADKRVRLHAGLYNKEQLPAYTIQGRKGSFIKQRGDVQEDTLASGIAPRLDHWGAEPTDKEGILHIVSNEESIRKTIPTLPGHYYPLFDGVYKAITENAPEPVTAIDGIRIMKVIEAAIKSSANRAAVTL
ncbi:Predicted dehydrogenase [Pustulibacterium marinum]|uniref:Predicted dehydrogenase n=1 Tax=Pustulibacterium marinum TaxID=1224947 RepID=A0A1I7GFH4_9FLAO|nr:Gfo/Idh/MocA family oxidoreductase [Pustulibacterium marinum]SFU47016.1 Predicted dehydrogenase [Pustulibacterium marinum]